MLTLPLACVLPMAQAPMAHVTQGSAAREGVAPPLTRGALVPTLSNRNPDARAALRRVLEDQQQRSQRRIFRISFVNIFCLRYHKQITQLIALWVTVTELPLFEFKLLQL